MMNLIPRRKDLMNFGENLFNDAFPEFWSNDSFSVDIKETDDTYEVKADLPGFAKENLHVDYHEDVLTIQAKREDTVEDKDENGNYIRKERSTRSFNRQFLVENVDEEQVSAKFTDGVLHVTLMKKDPSTPKRKGIDIE